MEDYMREENGESRSDEQKKDTPVFERRLRDIRVVCWRNVVEGGRNGGEAGRNGGEAGRNGAQGGRRVWFHTTVSRTFRKNDELHEAPGSLNGLPDITLAIAGLQAAKEFIERQPEA
jgi:hypothetical protein